MLFALFIMAVNNPTVLLKRRRCWARVLLLFPCFQHVRSPVLTQETEMLLFLVLSRKLSTHKMNAILRVHNVVLKKRVNRRWNRKADGIPTVREHTTNVVHCQWFLLPLCHWNMQSIRNSMIILVSMHLLWTTESSPDTTKSFKRFNNKCNLLRWDVKIAKTSIFCRRRRS